MGQSPDLSGGQESDALEQASERIPDDIALQAIISKVRMLVLPGLGNSGPDHWQSLWLEKFAAHGTVRVEQDDWVNANKDEWVAKMDEYIQRYPNEEILLVGHSLACLTIVHWVRDRYNHAIHKPKIKGALLVAPTDPEKFPPNLTGFAPMPLDELPFQTTVVGSTNDPWIEPDLAESYSKSWKAKYINSGAKGHLNTESQLGEWLPGQELVYELLAA